MLFKKINVYLSSLLIAIFIIMALSLYSETQKIPLIVKKQFFYKQKQNFKDTISKRIGIDYPFVVGYNYSPVTNNESNHPYFKKNKWEKGSLLYQGILFPVEGIKYDIKIDKLIYIIYDKDYKMNCVALDENFIVEFNILNSTFRYYNGLKNNFGRKLKAGYYEVVYDGKLKFLVQSEKSETMNDFSSSTDLYLLKDGKMIRVNSMSRLKKQLKDREKVVAKYIKENSLILNKSDYSSAFKVLKFYENL